MQLSIVFKTVVLKKMSLLYLTICAMLLKCLNSQTIADQRRYRLSPQDSGLKPADPLDEVPFPDLIENPSSFDDPRTSELNGTALRLKLGSNFDPHMMSVNPPMTNEKDKNMSYFNFRRNRLGRLIPTGTMPDFLSKMDFKHLTMTNGSKLRTKISPKLKRKIQQFLWAYTACPVVYKWKDLGVRFWPRYLKTGHCPENVSCSIPPGMTCRPSASTHKTILRWLCKNHSHNSHRRCQWIKMEYPVLTECSCSCSTDSSNN